MVRIPVFARRSSFQLGLTLVLASLFCLATVHGQTQGSKLLSSSLPADFAIQDGDRILFYGDSITEQRLYTTYVEHYILTRFPERHVAFINTGWGGDSVNRNSCVPCAGVGGLARLKRDVLDHKPTVVTLLFGMNDGDYKDFDPAIMKVYIEGLRDIIHGIKAGSSARIYVMTPTVYDGTRHTSWSHTDKYNDVLDRYSVAAKMLADSEGLPVIDLHAATTQALMAAKGNDASYTFLDDGVHPGPDGQLVMATEILRSWGASPSGLEFETSLSDGGSNTATAEVKAPLPWPQPVPSAKLNQVAPQIMALGRVIVKLKGLGPGSWNIAVDGAKAGAFTSDQLASGIDLNASATSAIASSTELAALIRKRADLFMLRWRQIEVPFAGNYAHGASAVAALDAPIGDMADREKKLAEPHTYKITITRQ